MQCVGAVNHFYQFLQPWFQTVSVFQVMDFPMDAPYKLIFRDLLLTVTVEFALCCYAIYTL